MSSILNIAAYRFVSISDPLALVPRLRASCEAWALKGTVLLASEGINLFLAGKPDAVHALLSELGQDHRFADLPVKFSESETVPFRHLRVKVKRELITFGDQAIAPQNGRAPALTADKLSEWLEQGRDDAGRELVMLDARNRQEVAFGRFAGAVTLPMEKFRDFPLALESQRDALQGKTVVSYCTGGIRCEKAALWLQQAGFDNVFQLEGGILGYFEQVGGQAYQGHCFVFDARLALDAELRPVAAT